MLSIKTKTWKAKKSGMRFHLNLNVNGKKDQKVWCIIEMAYYKGEDMYYFTHPKGNFEYNGHLAVYKQLTPTYENSVWKDLQLFIPYQEFRNSIGEVEEWRKGITYCVKVTDSDGKVLFQEWQDSKRIGYYQHIYPYVTCPHCKGNGRCNLCLGTGRVEMTVHIYTCSSCQGRGICKNCGGKGRKKQFADTMTSYDIQVKNSNSDIISPYYDNTPVSNGGNYSKPETSSKTICSICGGTGRCSNCAGRGEKNYSDGTRYECHLCGGGGVCKYCRGRGYLR